MVCILYSKGPNGLEICVGAIQDSEDVIIIRTTDDYQTEQQTFIKDARLKLCKNGIKRKDAIRFIKELVTEDFNTYILCLESMSSRLLYQWCRSAPRPDHPFPYIVVKTLPENTSCVVRVIRIPLERIPMIAVETAASLLAGAGINIKNKNYKI